MISPQLPARAADAKMRFFAMETKMNLSGGEDTMLKMVNSVGCPGAVAKLGLEL